MAKLTLTDIAAGYVLVATFNANNALLEAALENTLSRDGTSPNTMSATLDMNSNRVVNMSNASGNQDAVTLAQLNAAATLVVPTTLSGLTDVDLTSVSNGDFMYHDGATFVETGGAVTWDGTNIFEISAALPRIQLEETDQALDEKKWRISVKDSDFRITTKEDDDTAGQTALTIMRTGTVVDEYRIVAPLNIQEQAAAVTASAAHGQLWVRDDAPTVFMFTDDDGEDQLIDPSRSEINTQNTNYTLVITDKGKTIHKASGGAGETITIPANASVAFPIGTKFRVENDGGGTLTVAITTDILTFSDDNSTGSRTIADGGSLEAIKVTATSWKCTGAQVT